MSLNVICLSEFVLVRTVKITEQIGVLLLHSQHFEANQLEKDPFGH